MPKPEFDDLVETLKYRFGDPNLNAVIKETLGPAHTPNLQFNIKHEIARLAKPCHRLMDFSDHRDIGVSEYVVNGMSHYLDPHTRKVFDREYAKYDNSYTQGVYEAAVAFFNEHQDSFKRFHRGFADDISLVRFADVQTSQEESMNLATPVRLYLLAPSLLLNDYRPDINDASDEMVAVTSSIGHSELRIKHKTPIPLGQLLAIRFEGLEKDLVFKQRYVVFLVIDTREEENTPTSVLKLAETDANTEFRDYVRNLIYSHKNRYKVEIDNVLQGALTKAHEQYFLPTSTSVLLVLDDNGDIQWVHSNGETSNTLDYFSVPGGSVLPALLAKDELLNRLNHSKNAYYFVQRGSLKGNKVFLSALVDERDASLALLRKFAGDSTARLFKITLSNIKQGVAFQTTTVPDEAKSNFGSLRIHRYSNDLRQQFAAYSQVLTMTPVMTESLRLMVEEQSGYQTQKQHLFTVTDNSGIELNVINANANDQRGEDRFLLRSPISFSAGDARHNAMLTDVSSLGFSCRLESHLGILTGSVIKVRFEHFFDKTTAYNLSNCRYVVIDCKNGILRATNTKYPDHDGRKFWQKMLDSKLDSLAVSGRDEPLYGIGRVLGNLACAHAGLILGFYRIDKTIPTVTTLAVPHDVATGYVSTQQQEEIKENFRLWYYSDACIPALQSLLTDSEDKPSQGLLVLSYDKGKLMTAVKKSYLVPLLEANNQLIENHIRIAQLNRRHSRLFLVTLRKTQDEAPRYYRDELNYIKRYAPHRYEKLRQQINEVDGVISFLDITDIWKQVQLKQETVFI